MRAVRYRLRIELRGGWRACAALGLVVGIVGGAVLALTAGARRTDSAYRRFLKTQDAYDVLVSLQTSPGVGQDVRHAATIDQIERLPNVADAVPTSSYFIIGFGAGVGVFVPPDSRIGTEINRYKMIEGRRLDPRNPTEAVVSFSLAEQYHLHVGSKLAVLHPDVLGPPPPDAPPDEVKAVLAARRRVLAKLPDNRLTVVGIEASPNEFPPQIEGTGRYLVHASPALYPIKDDLAFFSEGHDLAIVRLTHGAADTPAFLAALARIGAAVDSGVQQDQAVGVNRSMHTQAVALRLLALLTALTGALILWQLLARLMYLEQSDGRVLNSLGMRRRDRWALGLGRAAVIGIMGALLSVALALLASPFFPTGLARIAEPHPGFAADGLVLAIGALGIAVSIVLIAAGPAWRAARTAIPHAAATKRLSLLGRMIGTRRAPLAVSTGARLALDSGRGASSTAVRSSLAAVTLGVATLVAALTFGAGLSHLLTTPSLYGQSWNVGLTTYDEVLPTRGVPVLAKDPRVQGVAVGRLSASFELDGRRVDGLAVDTVSGELAPTILAGRRPAASDEIALGSRTLRTLHLSVGDTVRARAASSDHGPVGMRIVGRAVFPLFGELGRLGDGAFLTRAGFGRVQGAPLAAASEGALVRLAPGADVDAVVHDLVRDLGNPFYGVAVIRQGKPTDVVNFGRVEATPYLLGAVLAVLSIVTLTYLLLSAVRRRRRDLAILKTLGFVRRQVRSMIACQATTLVLVALLIGIPLGIATGRWIWIRFADDLGIVAVPVIPVVAIAAAALLAVVIGNVVAAGPAAIAARTKPARVLRSE